MGAAASIDEWKESCGQDVIDELKWGTRDISKAAAEVIDLMKVKGISEEQAKAEMLEGYRNLPPIRLIDFDVFKKHGELPRLGIGKSERFPSVPYEKDLTVPLMSIDREKSFIVFVSHVWMAGWNGLGKEGEVVDQQTADAWRGYPHPDNKDNAKYKLEVDGIKWLIKTLAPGCKTYIWNDFSCLDQNGSPSSELRQLDKIIEMSNCIFTPIVDPLHETWEYPTDWENYFTQYKAKAFSEGPYAYVNRAWCRVEMLYAANIPLQEGKINPKFCAALQEAVKMNLRPHYLYGDKEKSQGKSPIQLAALTITHVEALSPAACIKNLSAASDTDKIHSLMTELKPYLKTVEVYEGKYKDGKYHGKGRFTYASGNVYEGDFKDGLMHGKGKYTYASGNVYEGDFKEGSMHGKGKHTYGTGNVYEGYFKADKRHKRGNFTYASGDEYDGEYVEGKKQGHGKYSYANGNVYEGHWTDNKKNRKGKFIFADGSVYEGDWKDEKKHGKGKYTYAEEGDVHEGEYKDNKRHGKGKFTYASGNVYEGDYKDGNMHGKGKFTYASGNVYEGDYKDDKKHGKGKFTYAEGDIYEGDYKDGNMHGKGKFTFKSGSVYAGEFKADKKHGKGKFYNVNGELYEGDWKDDKKQ